MTNNLISINDIDNYQEIAVGFAVYHADHAIVYPTLGLVGEAGEVAEKVKKMLRGDGNLDRGETVKELGDVLWYVANLANDLGYRLSDVAQGNIDKLRSRKERDAIRGSGDNR